MPSARARSKRSATTTKNLARYRQKRDFTKTDEPSGKTLVRPTDALRFVIQKHAASHLHYDLRLELDGVFRSWAVTRGPSIDPADKRLAVEVEDHPLDYGDFEGSIPKGEYGGGTVQLWDRGYWLPEGKLKPREALRAGDLKFTLKGERLKGSWVLVRMKNDRTGGKRTNWLLIKHRDAAARPGKAQSLLDLDRSIASGRSMAQIASGKGRIPRPFMGSAPADRSKAIVSARPDAKSTRRSGRTRAATAPTLKAMPRFIAPQLCKLVDRPPTGTEWAHEVKFDGYRMQLRVQRGNAHLYTRRGLDWTRKFKSIATAARQLPDCIVDGEICALDADHMPSFAALQAALSDGATENLVFFAFDLLIESREDLRSLPLTERKSRLQTLLASQSPSDSLHYVEHFESSADTLLLSACKMHLEGIVSKRLESPYVSARTGAWTKSKCRAGHEVVLGGWTAEAGQVRSLLAGVNRDGQLIYVGRVGTGYGAAVTARLAPTLRKLTRKRNPFGGDHPPAKDKKVRWLVPTLVAEIEFAGWTTSGMIRQAAFKGLRRDKRAADVIAEIAEPLRPSDDSPDERLAAKVQRSTRTQARSRSSSMTKSVEPAAGTAKVMGVVISKPQKILWPDAGDGTPITKLDLANYYQAVGSWLLPHVHGRPCSLLRAPDGFSGEQFFQRHAMAGISNLFSLVKIKGDKAPYVQIDRIEALAAVAQTGALEIHPWNGAPDNPDIAGRLVFDLDPGTDVKFSAVVSAALEIRERLKAVGLLSFCKTTGGKGLHVVAPLLGGKDSVQWPAAKNFAHVICAQMARDSPQRYVDNMSKSERVGRIFLDYLRNDRTATAVAVLSPRARAGATVSMPLDWNRIKPNLNPQQYTVKTAPTILLKTKPWKSYDDSARSLLSAIRKVTS